MSASLRRFRHLVALLLTVVLGVAFLPMTATTASAAGDDVTFVGHGYGHGRGMGQYGALGYAVDDGWSSAQILDHFYGGTVAGSVGNPEMTVELLSLNGKPLVVAGSNIRVNGVDVGNAVKLTVTGSTVVVQKGTGCASTWGAAVAGSFPVNSTRVTTTTPPAAVGDLLRVCEANAQRAYRGSLSVVSSGGTQMTVNHLPTESYLRGVVPRESPASWGSLGAGRGMQALAAQAVAARSYALASRRSATGAHTCDTTSCQVYGGAGTYTSSWTLLENAVTDAAIAATAGVVRFKTGTTTPVRTEFSSSTGGYTAGGEFNAVPDAGDDITANPYHTWTTGLSLTTVAAKLGSGAIRSIAVTARNGLGADGGRATTVTVVRTDGQVRTYTGNQVRLALGLRSDWFSISGVTVAAAQQVVKAVYQDVLGRSVDPAGLATWTEWAIRTGSAQGLLQRIVTSPERMNALVADQYQLALQRDPEPGGLETWVGKLQAGGGVYDLQVGIYGSPESLQSLGAGSVDTWVGALYESMLGRTAGASERQYWVDVAAVRGRGAVVAAIARSDESGMRRLTVYYQTFLQRGVDPSGRGTFLPLMNGRGDFDVPVKLGSSPEYWSRAQTRTF